MSYNGISIGVFVSVCFSLAISKVVLAHVFKKKPKKKCLIGINDKVPIRLISRYMYTDDIMHLRFALPTPQHILGLPIGNYVYLQANIDGELVTRPYTPIDVHIEIYQANKGNKFPNGGKMSQYLSKIKLESYVDMSGPAGNLEYKDCGLFHIKSNPRTDPKPFNAKYVNMICGGTGITPMYQLLRYILSSDNDETTVSLLYANDTSDLILKQQLEEMIGSNFRVWFTICKKHERSHWDYGIGFVDAKTMNDRLFPPSKDTLTLICGPPPMIELTCLPNLAKLEYMREHIFVF